MDTAAFRLIVLPFFIRSLALVGGYAAVRFCFDVQSDVLRGVTREMWELWMPGILAAIFCIVVMRRRFTLLKPDKMSRSQQFSKSARKAWRKEQRLEAIYWISGIALAVSMFGTQIYITSQASELILLDSLSAVGNPRPGNCFIICSDYVIDAQRVGFLSESRTVHKRYGRNKLDLIVYAALPMREPGTSPIRMLPTGEPDIYTVHGITPAKYWFVKEYKMRVNRPSDAEIRIAYDSLGSRIERDLSSGKFRRFDHLTAAPHTEHSRSMFAAIKNSPMRATADPVILSPETKPFSRSNGGLWTALIAWGVAFITVIIYSLSYSISEKRLADRNARAVTPFRERFNPVRLVLAVKKGGGVATWTLIGLNAVYFVTVVAAGISPMSPSPRELFEMGGATNGSILGGEAWRIATAMFLHSGIVHLAYNMFTFAFFGIWLESIVKPLKYVVIYFASGVGAALLSMLFLDPDAVHVGASGAIFGVMGAMGSLWVRNRKKYNAFPLFFLCTGGISLLLGLLPGINNWAHIGGLATGFVLGMFFYIPPKKRRRRLPVKTT